MVFVNKRKKQQIGAFIIFMLSLITLAVTIVIGKYVFFTVADAFATSGLSTTAADASFTTIENSWANFDYGFIFVLVGLTIGLVITSFMIPAHPVFLPINLFGMILLVFLGAVMSNVYGEIINTDGINTTISQGGNNLGNITYLMSYLPFICAFVVFISTVVMYSKAINL